jgi:cytochrome P450
MPSFSPKAVKGMEGKIRYWAEKIVGEVADRGECDFIHDVTELFPVSIFMELMGMDLGRLREFRRMAEAFFDAQNRGHPADLEQALGAIIGVMTEYILEKQKNPADDLISQLTRAQIDGRPIRLDEMQNMCALLFVGGLHTVTNLSGFAFWHLAGDPELQALLVEHPERIPDFVEESIRMFGVINTPRIVAKDCEKFGVRFTEGDMVLCMLPQGSRDGRVNSEPNRFDLDRKQREYLTFSKGPHLCVGHFLARSELRILTEEWLKRVPRFHLQPGARQHYSPGPTIGLTAVPQAW